MCSIHLVCLPILQGVPERPGRAAPFPDSRTASRMCPSIRDHAPRGALLLCTCCALRPFVVCTYLLNFSFHRIQTQPVTFLLPRDCNDALSCSLSLCALDLCWSRTSRVWPILGLPLGDTYFFCSATPTQCWVRL